MKLDRQPLVWTAALAAMLALSACGKKDDNADAPPAADASPPATSAATAPAASSAVSVTAVDLGNAVDPAQKVATPTASFSPKDTVYASVATSGSGSGKLDAKWTYQDGQTVYQDSATIHPGVPANTAFKISKPDGFPAGNYKVDIALDGKPVASKDFSVQ